MAQNTESSGTGLRPYRNYAEIIGSYPQTTNSTFVAGHLVQLGSGTNTHRIASASSLSTSYLGIAGEAGSSNATPGAQEGQRRIPVYQAHPHAEFLGWAKEAILSTMVGQFRSFARDSTMNIDYVAVNSTAAELRIQITEVGADSNVSAQGQLANIGDTNGYVAFRFLNEFTAFGKTT